MKTRTSDRTRVPPRMRAIGATEPHPRDGHLYRLGRSTLYIADVTAILGEQRATAAVAS